MPLRVTVRPDTGTLWITGTVRPAGAATGYRVRQRAGTDDPKLAAEEAAALERDIIRNHHLGQRPVERGFAAAVISYMQHEARSEGTKDLVNRLLRHLGNMPLRTINQETVDEARKVLLREGAAPGTVNRNLIVPLRAIMHHAARRGWCDEPKFQPLREPGGRVDFLLPVQFEAIHAAADARLRPLYRFLVCTGCRLGETLALQWPQVDLGGGAVNLWADQTKADKRRVVRLPPTAVAELAGLRHREGHVFLSRGGKPYTPAAENGGGQINTGLATACRNAKVPEITAHVFRHTFASWHWALYRDLIALRNDGGWSSVELVERYAHLMPAGQEEAIWRVWGLAGPVAVVARA